MRDDGLNQLDRLAGLHPLQGLEDSVWAAVEDRSGQSRVTALQAAVLSLALITSMGAGAYAAAKPLAGELGVFSPSAALSPATRLGGF